MTKSIDESLLIKIKNALKKGEKGSGATEAEAMNAMALAQRMMAKHGLSMKDIDNVKSEKEKAKTVEQGAVSDAVEKNAWWKVSLSAVIADNFRCYTFRRVYSGGTKIIFLGLAEDVEIAKSVFDYASQTIEYNAKAYRRAKRKEMESRLPKGIDEWTIDEMWDYLQDELNGYCKRYSDEATQRKYLTLAIKEALGIKIDGPAIRNDYIKGFIRGLRDKFKEQVKANEQEWGLVLVKDALVVQEYNKLNMRTSKASSVSSNGDREAFNNGYRQGKNWSSPTGSIGSGNKALPGGK